MPILQTRGPTHGICNICGIHGPLIEDHTPPKGYAPGVPVQITHIAERLGSERRPRFQKAPDGVKYRTLCADCNTRLLGAEYDPALIRMANDASRLLTSGLFLPPTTTVRISPQRVARSVLGHMAAQGINRYLKGAITEPLRDYLLRPELPMLPDARLTYWIYPHRSRVLIRDAVIGEIFSNGKKLPSMIWLMKCFPLAFAVLWERDFSFEGAFQPRDFDAYAKWQIDDTVDLPIDLFNVPHEFWPEAPTNTTILLMGEQALAATVSPSRGRLLKNVDNKGH